MIDWWISQIFLEIKSMNPGLEDPRKAAGALKQDLAYVDLIPWSFMVIASWDEATKVVAQENDQHAFIEGNIFTYVGPSYSKQNNGPEWSREWIETVKWYHLTSLTTHNADGNDYAGMTPMDQASRLIFNFLTEYPAWQDLFCGLSPYSNDKSKNLASLGSYFYDLCYYQIAHIYSMLGTNTYSQLNAPNKEFNMLYRKTLEWAVTGTTLHTNMDTALNRSSNNKGNTMDILMLAIAEAGQHGTVWTLVWIQFMQHHKNIQAEWRQLVDVS